MRYIRCPRNCDYTQASILKRKLKRARLGLLACMRTRFKIDRRDPYRAFLRALRLRYRRGRRSNFAYRVVLSVIYCERHYRHYYRRLGLYQETTLASRLKSRVATARTAYLYASIRPVKGTLD